MDCSDKTSLSTTPLHPGQLFPRALLAEAFARLGRLPEAKDTLETVVERAQRFNAPLHEDSARRMLGEVIMRLDATPNGCDRAARQIEAAIGLLDRIGAENELAIAYAAYARVEQQRGEHHRADAPWTPSQPLGTIVDPYSN